MKVIPAIDIINGRCVRLVQGDYESVINYQEVEATATEFFDKGVTSLHIVDLDAAKLGCPVNVASIQGVVGRGGAEIQVGGGVRSLDSAKIYLDMGVSRVVVGTSVVHDREFFALLNKEYPGRVVASLDYRRVGRKLMVATHGWQKSSEVELFAAIAAVVELGCRNVLATDISKDGTFRGPDTVTYGQILERFDVDLIASGGVGSISDLEELSMVEASNRQLYGAVVGRAIHDGRIDVQEALARWR